MVYALFLGDRITPVLHPAMSVIHSEQSTLANVAIQCPLLRLLKMFKDSVQCFIKNFICNTENNERIERRGQGHNS
jgi:hypothetical protein